jgi:uncharacterized protein (TIGR02001 family)
MKLLLLLGIIVLSGTTSHAQEIEGHLSLTSDYTVRGISLSDGHASVSAGLDLTTENFYFGTLSSSVDFNNGTHIELYLNAGYTTQLADISLDFGGMYYTYPDAPGDLVDQNFAEFYVFAEKSFGAFSWDIGASYSPDFYMKSGTAWYTETGLNYALNERVAIDARMGSSTFVDPSFDYRDYQFGLSGPLAGSTAWDLRYYETSFGSSGTILTLTFGL